MSQFWMLGQSALSPFRIAKLRQRIAAGASAAAGDADTPLTTRLIDYVELDEGLTAGDLTDGEARHLRALLNSAPESLPARGQHRLAVPRLGTVSPWSSKATDILHHCGLHRIRRVERGILYHWPQQEALPATVEAALFDPLTQSLLHEPDAGFELFRHEPPAPLRHIDLSPDPLAALAAANRELGLALSDDEMRYLAAAYEQLGRPPTDAELMMFAQANSEHCRHKIFNADWWVDGEARPHTLFNMIRNTMAVSPAGVLSAYSDNAAVIEGYGAERFMPAGRDHVYGFRMTPGAIQIKVETHNHPTAISPHPGAATGSGGEIRDESATGRGARPKAGLTGFSVSALRLDALPRDWEPDEHKPPRIASALEIMRDGPIGAASFNNEFGRPALAGYFRSFEQHLDGCHWGYHKPIMLAGGYGNIAVEQVDKQSFEPGAPIVVLGGPAMLIGLGGGAASSVGSGSSSEALDFASVQRGNPEMQRRCQEVINQCWAAGEGNPIRSIHDVGAGGLSNAIPELLHDGGRGGRLDLRRIPNADSGMSPMQIWCNEAQERYVLMLDADGLEDFAALCRRERCPYAVLGQASDDGVLRLDDSVLGEAPVDMPLDILLGRPPKMERRVQSRTVVDQALALESIDLEQAIRQVLGHPTVACKQFLITIGDRSVGGLTVRDQMVGPWQVPVADAAVTLAGFSATAGEAMAVGERTPLAITDAAAAARMAVSEAITNIASAPIESLGRVKLSANWMAAAGAEGQDAALYAAVEAVGMGLCPDLGIAIPVGKDSLSMQVRWPQDQAGHGVENGAEQQVTSPVSLIVSAFAPVDDVRQCLTPQLHPDEETRLLLIDLAAGRNRLGGSILAQCQSRFGGPVADLDDPVVLRRFFAIVQEQRRAGHLLAYHDRSDGGLMATLLEMAFAGRCGLQLNIEAADHPALLAALFAEEPGAVVQVAADHVDAVREAFSGAGARVIDLGHPAAHDRLRLHSPAESIDLAMGDVLGEWSRVSFAMQRLRDDPDCADEAERAFCDWHAPGLSPHLQFPPDANPAAPLIGTGARPRVAILREQGVNSQVEMAAGFHQTGFEAVDVHMTDLVDDVDLSAFQGLVVCGGFSYGDVLGAGRGWAGSIRYHDRLRRLFEDYFHDTRRFTLGVCNGCQMLAGLRTLIPGAEHWPVFRGNRSEQFESRLSLVEVVQSPSILLQGMNGSVIPIATAHGEGRVVFEPQGDTDAAAGRPAVTLRYVDNHGRPAQQYPANPNGSPGGVTGFCNQDGRINIMMPHPERTLRTVNYSWAPADWPDASPWMRLFHNARAWLA